MPDPAAAPKPPPSPMGVPHAGEPRVIVRPMPKIVFFYLTWLASLAFGVMSPSSDPANLGVIWMGIFALNVLVISFDFSEMGSVAVVALLLCLVFAGLYFGFLGFLGTFVQHLDIRMNAGFYFTVFGLFTAIYLIVFIRSRFEYWEFRNNEVIHRTGMFGEMKRYSTEDLRWFKEIPDVLERVLLGSGRMVLTTPHESIPIVIDNVIGIGRVDERIASLLGTKNVTVK